MSAGAVDLLCEFRAHYSPEHELWRYVIYRCGAVLHASQHRFPDDLSALHAAKQRLSHAAQEARHHV